MAVSFQVDGAGLLTLANRLLNNHTGVLRILLSLYNDNKRRLTIVDNISTKP